MRSYAVVVLDNRSGTYDPQLDLVYWDAGNAEPYDPRPRGELDSPYTSSVLAIRPKTGEIVCYYQYAPKQSDLDEGVNRRKIVRTQGH